MVASEAAASAIVLYLAECMNKMRMCGDVRYLIYWWSKIVIRQGINVYVTCMPIQFPHGGVP